MDTATIAALLVPYMKHNKQGITLSETFLSQISTYLDLLLRWNTRTNLTAIRTPEEIITRHFGESLFAACQIFPQDPPREGNSTVTLADVGSGAGFPGLPIKLWAPQVRVSLIESHEKKATFLREVIRALKLDDVEVHATRAEQITRTFDTVTLRAVEHFDQVLAAGSKLIRPGGRLALLIGEEQIASAKTLLPTLQWDEPHRIPNSQRRIVFLGVTREEARLQTGGL